MHLLEAIKKLTLTNRMCRESNPNYTIFRSEFPEGHKLPSFITSERTTISPLYLCYDKRNDLVDTFKPHELDRIAMDWVIIEN